MPELRDWSGEGSTVSCMPSDIDWIPTNGAHLTSLDLVGVMSALRAAINGTEEDEPNRAHLVHIAVIIAQALQRSSGVSE